MQLFRDVNIRWMKLKWYFIGLTFIFLIAGWASVLMKGGFRLSVDFTGGTIVNVKFAQKPDLDRLRPLLKEKVSAVDVTRFDKEEKNIVQIKLPPVRSEEATRFQKLGEILNDTFHGLYDASQPASKRDINKERREMLAAHLKNSRVLENNGTLKPEATIDETSAAYYKVASSIVDYRNSVANGGLIRNLDGLRSVQGVPGPMVDWIKTQYYTGSYTVLSVDNVGPKIGKELQGRAFNAVMLSFLGMLVYVAFRFRFAYGLGAVIALFHDILITLGLLCLTNREISLTVIAAILTLVGYSMNDTIVVFDRIRENLKLAKNETFEQIIDNSINQTLSRTIITSGLTFISVFCLWIFGGETLDAFSLVLSIGIIIGTYSSIAVASPIMYWLTKYAGTAKDKKTLRFATNE